MNYRITLLLSALFLTAACASLPPTTRTGAIHEIKFEEHLMPTELTAQVGDEIRWVNHRSMPARVDFPGVVEDVSCERGFRNFFSLRQESATVRPNESVSLCFAKSGFYTYNARMDAAVPGGKLIEQGSIRVGTPAR